MSQLSWACFCQQAFWHFSIARTTPCCCLSLQARLSAKQDRHYSSLGAVPGNNLELQAVDEERFTAAALFGLAGTEEGLQALLQQEGQVLTGMKQQCVTHWLWELSVHRSAFCWHSNSCLAKQTLCTYWISCIVMMSFSIFARRWHWHAPWLRVCPCYRHDELGQQQGSHIAAVWGWGGCASCRLQCWGPGGCYRCWGLESSGFCCITG